jgi:hypothetical protein
MNLIGGATSNYESAREHFENPKMDEDKNMGCPFN